MQRLYVMQHAEAKPKDIDPERGLTPEGIAHIKKTGNFIAQSSINISEIWHSDKKRAADTAQVLSEYQQQLENTQSVEGLHAKDDPKELEKKLKNVPNDKTICLIGHLPHLANLTALLLKTKSNPVNFKNAGLISLVYSEENEHWLLDGYVSPDMLKE